MTRKFKILERKADCVLVKYSDMDKYKVRDIENDDIAIGTYEHCKLMFDSYDINKVHEEKKREFEKWLDEFAEA